MDTRELAKLLEVDEGIAGKIFDIYGCTDDEHIRGISTNEMIKAVWWYGYCCTEDVKHSIREIQRETEERIINAYRCIDEISETVARTAMTRVFGETGSTVDSDIYNSESINKALQCSFVYIARQTNEGNVYKIGMSKDISTRERAFRTGNAFIDIIASKKTPNARRVELLIHKLYSGKNISGEWFELNDDDINEIISSFGFNIQISQEESK